MKRLSILLISVFLLVLSVPTYAHPGGTDANGGHYNRSTGVYHYHHGYSEHQHPGGVCPYAYNDRTGSSSSSSGGSSVSKTPSSRNDSSSTGSVTGGTTSKSTKTYSSSMLYFSVFAGVVFVFGLPVLVDFISNHVEKRRASRQLPPVRSSVPPLSPVAPVIPVAPVVPIQKPAHRLDLSDRFEVISGNRTVTLYGLPGIQISHVGYLRDTEQLFIRFRDDNCVYVYSDVPLSLCSDFVRSRYPDEFYDTFIDRQFHIQRLH